MPRPKKLVGVRCALAPISTDDAALWAAWETDLAVALPLGGEAHTPATAEAMHQHIRDACARHEHIFTIVANNDDAAIGRCMLFNLDHINQSAMLGILIGDATYRGRGYGQEALRLLLDYGFALLNLHSVMLGVFAFNTPAIRCYRRVGFHEIGRRRQVRLIGGRRHDAILMDMLADEYQPGAVRQFLPEPEPA